MENPHGTSNRESQHESVTAQVVRRFISAFQDRDPSRIPELVAKTCVMEGMQPAPDGLRVEGYADNVRFWQAMVADTSGTFETEDLVVLGDRAINRWRYRSRDGSSVRGVTLLRVEDGKIVEALGYGKTPGPDAGTAEVIRRFNDVFQRHDPTALPDLVSADCVIENTTPAPNGARYVGRQACVNLWTSIATSAGMRFDLEDVVIAGDRATIRWRLVWGDREEDCVRGVNLMRVQQGQITEALGYVKAGPSSPRS
jgi:ketosteroid isomerase-like protein